MIYQGPNHPKKKEAQIGGFGMPYLDVCDGTIQRKTTKRASLRMNHGMTPISKYMFNPPISNARSTWKKISIRSSEETKIADMVFNMPKYLTYTPISDKMFIGETMIYKNKP